VQTSERRPLLVSKGWVQAVLLVVLFGFFVLGLLAYRTYMAKPPTPQRVVDPSGQTLYTAADIHKGQQVFLHNGLMEFGSVFGHGAYLGPDYTADYLRRAANFVIGRNGGAGSDSAARRTIAEFRTNRYVKRTGTLTLTASQTEAYRRLIGHYSRFFSDPTTEHGLRPHAITDRNELRQLTAFFGWTAWAASTERPGHDYSYTNNWPPEPRVDNKPTANVIVWSVLSLIALLGGIGILFGVFGRWRFLGWHGREQATLSFRSPGDVALTPAQRACAWFFFVMAALFLIQTLVGAASQHYRADVGGFFGIDLARVFPYNLMRTWHIQLAIFWVATSFVAAGIFLAPMIARREPKHQGTLAFALLGALAIVVFGTLIGSYLGVHGVLQGAASNWFGLQGFEYLDLARLWQVLLTVGLFVWLFMLWRVMRRRLAGEHRGNMPWLFFLAALAIPAFYAVGLIARTGEDFTTTEFWRFWVVHLWVEDFLELFTTVMVAYMFVLLGVVREKVALTVI
jgi:nitric oxide reductase subunit B